MRLFYLSFYLILFFPLRNDICLFLHLCGNLLRYCSQPLPNVDDILYESKLVRHQKRKLEANDEVTNKAQEQNAFKACIKYSVGVSIEYMKLVCLNCEMTHKSDVMIAIVGATQATE